MPPFCDTVMNKTGSDFKSAEYVGKKQYCLLILQVEIIVQPLLFPGWVFIGQLRPQFTCYFLQLKELGIGIREAISMVGNLTNKDIRGCGLYGE